MFVRKKGVQVKAPRMALFPSIAGQRETCCSPVVQFGPQDGGADDFSVFSRKLLASL